MKNDFVDTCQNTIKKSKELIVRSDIFRSACKTKYTTSCDSQVDKDILLADELLEYAEKLSDLIEIHLQKCGMPECVESCRKCKNACQNSMNSINELIIHCKDEKNNCADLYQDVKNTSEVLVHKVQICLDKFCNM